MSPFPFSKSTPGLKFESGPPVLIEGSPPKFSIHHTPWPPLWFVAIRRQAKTTEQPPTSSRLPTKEGESSATGPKRQCKCKYNKKITYGIGIFDQINQSKLLRRKRLSMAEIMSGNQASPSFRPPARSTPTGLSLNINTSPSLNPPTANRLRNGLLPSLSIQTDPSSTSSSTPSLQPYVPLSPSISDDSPPSPAAVEDDDFGKQVRKCIGDENGHSQYHLNNGVAEAFEKLDISTSRDGDDEATPPPPRESDIEEIADMDEEGWRKATREGGVVEICILGEGSSGSVSRCRLRNGTQEFALKVTVPLL